MQTDVQTFRQNFHVGVPTTAAVVIYYTYYYLHT